MAQIAVEKQAMKRSLELGYLKMALECLKIDPGHWKLDPKRLMTEQVQKSNREHQGHKVLKMMDLRSIQEYQGRREQRMMDLQSSRGCQEHIR
jgi:hypothetical protein